MTPSVIFLGSFQHYSAIVLEALLKSPQVKVLAVVTTPPVLVGKAKILQKNPVHQLADDHGLVCLTPTSLESLNILPTQPDILFTAGYGKLLPPEWLQFPKVAALNLHFSLLPKYRGANPAEWAILLGETETGVTIIEMSPEFDTGAIIAQASLPLEPTETRLSAYQKLYELGARISPAILNEYTNHRPLGHHQPASPTPYAKRFTRQDGFISWSVLQTCLAGQNLPIEKLKDPQNCGPLLARALEVAQVSLPLYLERACRALAEFPSLWTEIPTSKGLRRMKILSCTLKNTSLILEKVQIEGQQPAQWNQVKNSIQK